ncbi:aldehyde dehydrogenase family protein [Micromonospora fluostatini]
MSPVRRTDLDLLAIDVIRRNHDALLDALVQVATHSAAVDEIRRSIRALAGAQWELAQNRPAERDQLIVFLPSNNVLYSYVLFGLVPALYCREVVARPSSRVASTTAAVHRILSADPAMPRPTPVTLAHASQREFLTRHRDADVAVFTGQPANADSVAASLSPQTLLLTFGSGPNPVVVGPDGDPEQVVPDLLRARLYNSGQDCLCPDVVFVHRAVAAELTERLVRSVGRLAVGPRARPDTVVSALTYPDVLPPLEQYLEQHARYVRSGGRVDRDRLLVEPTVLLRPWTADVQPPEFFAPVFDLVEYDHAGQIRAWLESAPQRRRGMYVSVYGETGLPDGVLGTSVVLSGVTTLDVEDGNRPFGGYGIEANSVRRGDLVSARPLLLSAELGPAGQALRARPSGAVLHA